MSTYVSHCFKDAERYSSFIFVIILDFPPPYFLLLDQITPLAPSPGLPLSSNIWKHPRSPQSLVMARPSYTD